LPTEPDDLTIARLASALNREIRSASLRLVREQLGRPQPGTEEWAAEVRSDDSPEKRNATKLELMTHLRVLKAAHANLDRAVVDARLAGVTWAEVGAGCGMSRQGAYDRWGKFVKQVESARSAAREPVDRGDLNPVDWALTKVAASADHDDQS
jgi:hypothetical protein